MCRTGVTGAVAGSSGVVAPATANVFVAGRRVELATDVLGWAMVKLSI